mmetsp:Transcript_21501/g.54143  ORF Transcript_21501/g.54143 Transcript_21501/m.54143 type:complete len:208 (+) Transcript_21501:87-710(+)|eukprot:CAMPEP_0178999880 /NCGR_PEP_ID=MMETSP0795-20121207/10345_1 /TAXON_ID=88552 /ORGANISM="Amoebophrya sp., Strain Ameob2" /LENGTH=207 /DNA_ID=CAMNT_0020692781 /DNA_START=24 /DNA_END=647 /DNA_ORIENTATION=+
MLSRALLLLLPLSGLFDIGSEARVVHQSVLAPEIPKRDQAASASQSVTLSMKLTPELRRTVFPLKKDPLTGKERAGNSKPDAPSKAPLPTGPKDSPIGLAPSTRHNKSDHDVYLFGRFCVAALLVAAFAGVCHCVHGDVLSFPSSKEKDAVDDQILGGSLGGTTTTPTEEVLVIATKAGEADAEESSDGETRPGTAREVGAVDQGSP